MLTAKEREVVRAVLAFCGERESCLISENDLLALVDIRKKNLKTVRAIVNSLVLDGYFDLVRCKRGEEDVLCITPKLKARRYEREREQLALGVAYKILLAVLGSLVAFLVTRLLYGLF